MSYSRWLAVTVLSLASGAFLAVLSASSIVAYIVAEPFYADWVPNSYAYLIDYPFTLRGVDCDVVIYGDSTALTGYDPLVIEKITHLKTCNIAQTRTLVANLGTWALDWYLAHNKKPRYVAIQMAPEGFHRDADWSKMTDPLPIIELPRHSPGIHSLWVLMVHYRATVNYISDAVGNRLSARRRAEADHMHQRMAEAVAAYRAHRGSFSIPAPASKKCSVERDWVDVDSDWIQAIRKKYSKMGIDVIVNASPIPDCDPKLERYRESLVHVTDQPVQSYPIGLFNDIDRHFTVAGRNRASTNLADQILAAEERRKGSGVKTSALRSALDVRHHRGFIFPFAIEI